MFAKLLLMVACLALTASANKQLWNQFKTTYGRTYATTSEDQQRYAIFASNLEKIRLHNAKYAQGTVSWYLGVNQFADLTPEEFLQTLTTPSSKTASGNNNPHQLPTQISDDVPDAIDWREKGAVTDVKNQGSCGSSEIISIVGMIEAQYEIRNLELVPLSVQNLVDCCAEGDCTGGHDVQKCLDYVKEHGLATEASYPTEPGSCRQGGLVFHISGYAAVKLNDEADLKDKIGTVGPVTLGLNAESFQLYTGGVFNDPNCSSVINHEVLAVGYGKEGEQGYWIIKNSWGPAWGEGGYIRIASGNNLCGLASQAYYPVPLPCA